MSYEMGIKYFIKDYEGDPTLVDVVAFKIFYNYMDEPFYIHGNEIAPHKTGLFMARYNTLVTREWCQSSEFIERLIAPYDRVVLNY